MTDEEEGVVKLGASTMTGQLGRDEALRAKRHLHEEIGRIGGAFIRTESAEDGKTGLLMQMDVRDEQTLDYVTRALQAAPRAWKLAVKPVEHVMQRRAM